MPSSVWHGIEYEELVDLGRIQRKMDDPNATTDEPADELDIELMKEMRLRASSAAATTSSSASGSMLAASS
jgi:hypothetical protein